MNPWRSSIAWNLTRTVDPLVPVVPLTELKDWSRISTADEDALMEGLGQAVTDAVASELSRALLTQTLVLRLDAFPYWDIRLPRPPLQSVTSVQYIDGAGAIQTLDPSAYTVDTASGINGTRPGRLFPAYQQVWPSTRAVPNAVTITYKAGKDAIEDVPEPIRTAIKLATADLFEHRERSALDVLKDLDTYERLMTNYRCVTEFNYV